MSDFEYDPEQMRKPQRLMQSDYEEATKTALLGIDFIESSQTESKWGVQAGAIAYRQKYIRNLGTLRTEVNVLQERAQDFVEALQACVKALEEDEENAVAAQQALQAHLAATEQPTTHASDKHEDSAYGEVSVGPDPSEGE